MIACSPSDTSKKDAAATPDSAAAAAAAAAAPADGQRIFRHETFGDEQFWTDTARMQEVIQASVSPKLALSVGLKVDADAVPAEVAAGIKSGKVDLDSPATTVALLKLGAVARGQA